MSESSPKKKRASRGVYWRHLRMGDQMGSPPAEWAHVTPEFIDGIPDSDLRSASSELQRRTALWWFGLNLEAYDLRKGGPYFGFSGPAGSTVNGIEIAGFDQAPFAPSPLKAQDVLAEEFADLLAPDLINAIGGELGDSWMWRPHLVRPPPVSAASSDSELIAALSAAVDDFQARLLQFPKLGVHGEIGHNQPAVLQEDAEAAFKVVEQVRDVLANRESLNRSRLAESWNGAKPLLFRMGCWLGERSNDFFSEFARESGGSIGKNVPWIVAAGLGHALIN